MTRLAVSNPEYKHIDVVNEGNAAVLESAFMVSSADGVVLFVGEHDYFELKFPKQDAIDMLNELIDYIEGCE